jgi:hypothetical protein
LLDTDADRADLELRLIKLLLKDRAHVHPFAGNGGSWAAKRTLGNQEGEQRFHKKSKEDK